MRIVEGDLPDRPTLDHQLTRKGEPFRGHDVTLNGLSGLIVRLALSAAMEVRQSLCVSQA